MKSERGGWGVLLDGARFSPRKGETVIVLSYRARFSKKQRKIRGDR